MSTPEDVLKSADDIEWDDLVAIGFDKAGRLIVITSSIGAMEMVSLLEFAKFQAIASAVFNKDNQRTLQ